MSFPSNKPSEQELLVTTTISNKAVVLTLTRSVTYCSRGCARRCGNITCSIRIKNIWCGFIRSKGSAQFFLDTLVENTDTRYYLVTNPSSRPKMPSSQRSIQLRPGRRWTWSYCAIFLTECVTRLETAGRGARLFRAQLAATRARLAPTRKSARPASSGMAADWRCRCRRTWFGCVLLVSAPGRWSLASPDS